MLSGGALTLFTGLMILAVVWVVVVMVGVVLERMRVSPLVVPVEQEPSRAHRAAA